MKKTICLALFLLTGAFKPQSAFAIAPLSYAWHCGASSPTLVECDFWVVPPFYHQAFRWNFGDGVISRLRTSTSVTHNYTVSAGHSAVYLVSLLGYATPQSSSPDNVIGCNVLVENGYGVGGDPGTQGTCQ